MNTPQEFSREAVFKRFEEGSIGYKQAVFISNFQNYNEFLDAFFAAGYRYPVPSEEDLAQESKIVCLLYHLNQGMADDGACMQNIYS